jgi:uncharacterized iron-regulated membrane protein
MSDAVLNTATRPRTSLRRWWVQVHLWLGLTFGVLGVFIGVSGSILVFEAAVDAQINPQRYALSGRDGALSYADYANRAQGVMQADARPTLMRIPQEERMPIVVFGSRADRSGLVRIYIDPPTGRILDVAPGGGFVGWVHRFHENLTLREYSGREIVGLVGIAMLSSSLTGIYLWWPRRVRFRDALSFRAGFALSRNLHYVFGFYSAVVLAMLSFTGIFLAYPDAGRTTVARFGPVSNPQRIEAPRSTDKGARITVDEAVNAARAAYPDASVSAVAFPSGQRGVYRVSLTDVRQHAPHNASSAVAFVDAQSGAVLRRIDASTRTSGDNFLGLQRTLHSGQSLGIIGRLVICAVGFMPALFVVTGTLMWLRQRRVSRRV